MGNNFLARSHLFVTGYNVRGVGGVGRQMLLPFYKACLVISPFTILMLSYTNHLLVFLHICLTDMSGLSSNSFKHHCKLSLALPDLTLQLYVTKPPGCIESSSNLFHINQMQQLNALVITMH